MQVFTSVLVLGIFFSVYVITDIKSYKERKVSNMISLAQVIATNSVSPLIFQDNDAANTMLSELKNGSPDIIHAAIIDKDGKLFAKYNRNNQGNLTIPAELADRSSVFLNDHLFVKNDIIAANDVAGKVIFEIELSELKQIYRSKFKLAIILLAIALIFSFLIAMIVQSYISKRLLYVVNTMKEVSRTGNYSNTISDEGQDELSTLIRVFNNMMQEIKANQQRKDEFIGVASHELKTPLTTVKGYLDLLYMIEDKDPNKQFVQKSLANVTKLENLIKDLLDVSKIQSGQLKLTLRDFSMDNLIEETVSAMKMVSETHDIRIDGSFGNEIIVADRLRIEQVLTNLLSNAIKYSPGEKRVIVSCITTENDLVVKVRDFGMGIPKDEQASIFERFYRTRDMTITITGFGLGLYICRDIIARHHGKIWMEAEDKGSSFYFSLPRKVRDEKAQAGISLAS
jgi:signal transduction histidine kinase